jgi:hypothetical protein
MNERSFSYVISRLKNDLFLEIIIVITSIYLIFRLINGFKKNKIETLFLTYSVSLVYLFAFGSDISLSVIFRENYSQKKLILEIGNIAFSIIEALTFYFYFKNISLSKKTLILINISGSIFLAFLCFCTFLIFQSSDSYRALYNLSFDINIVEFFLLFFICLSYYSNIINISNIKKAINLNELLIVNSLFLYISIALPFLSMGPSMIELPKWTHNCMVILHYLSIINILVTLIFVQKKQNCITQ